MLVFIFVLKTFGFLKHCLSLTFVLFCCPVLLVLSGRPALLFMNREYKACRICKRSCQEIDPAHEDGRYIRWDYESQAKVIESSMTLLLEGRLGWHCKMARHLFLVFSYRVSSCLVCLGFVVSISFSPGSQTRQRRKIIEDEGR